MQTLQSIPEWHNVDDRMFQEEIISQYRPAVLRGFVSHWPAVQRAQQSDLAICHYIKSFDSGSEVNAIMTRPEEQGRIHYRANMDGFNFVRNRLPISAIIDQLLRYAGGINPPSVAAQSAFIPTCLPGFAQENPLTALPESVAPRIWIGNTITVPAHVDDANNIACVVSGKRRFTLFPPEQVANLYIGPLDYTPAGAPISLVAGHQPDLQRYPNYSKALAAAQVAELLPGDAIYIPPVWWHQVESLGSLNILINYWWGGSLGSTDRSNGPIDCLLHCLMNLKDLPAETRQAWGTIFNYYVFNAPADLVDHIPEHKRGVLGEISVEQMSQLRAGLISKLQG